MGLDFFVKFGRLLFHPYKHKLNYCLTFNEIHTILPHPFTTPPILSDPFHNLQQPVYQPFHHQFLPTPFPLKYSHQIIPPPQIPSILTKLTTYPYSSNPKDLLNPSNNNHFNIFFTHVQLPTHYPPFINPLFKQKNIHIQKHLAHDQLLNLHTL
ncbi:family 1 glycosylhydrolase, partial [Bacillus sp. WP8]|uniref:family 1 glycosylhydrolase n=1 Tax=Bacillus sp. WP8 TaxID=756828 RepID=UPI0037BEA6BF